MKVSVIPDPSVRLANIKAGTIDYIVVNANQYRLVKDDPELNVATFPTNWLVFLTFNTAKGPCADIRVRQAISHAIDRNALVMGTQFGLGRVSSCMYPDDHWAHNPDLKPVTYDPELSKRLLAQAGYPNGLTLKGFTINAPEAQAFAKAVMAMLAKAGITWKPEFLGITAMLEPFRKLDFDIVGNLYPWIQEPDHMATLLYDPSSPFNNGRSRNPKAIALIKAGREERNEAKRAKIYHQLEKALYDNYEDAWLWWPNAVLASRKTVKGFNLEMFTRYNEGYIFSHPQWFKDGHP
jgi:peptide/nickel transport system substrate-binding protein